MSAAPPLAACLRPVRAVVFDTDGVLLDSAGLHAAAWQQAFDACLTAAGEARPFDPVADYLRHVDGRSRLDGAAAFLASRGLALPPGARDDPPGTGTVAAVAARKEQAFTALLREGGAAPWPDSIRLLHALRAAGVPCAAVSASRHATELLSGAGLLGLFAVVVDGRVAARLGLSGKPDPALFIEAARRLAVPPREAAVVEDAEVGVEAGRRGGFALVVGVDRSGAQGHAAALRRRGADVVVDDLGDLLVPGAAP
ncbi:HAD-IA family hydrolase [Streptomyces noursei]|uniref:HAD family hydrolase n=1 Tax=Streptomyces noursei TaxID=1971 RepID=UPI0033D0A554